MKKNNEDHMQSKIHSLRGELQANVDTLEDFKKQLEKVLQKKGDTLDIDFGDRLHVKEIKKAIAWREEEIERLRIELTKYEVALQRDEYID